VLQAPHQHYSWRARTKPLVSFTGAAPAASTTSSPSVAKPALFVQRLTPAEVAQCRKDGQCFHCNDFFMNGHKVVCK
jgi:hypothetical protein